ncbi:MAG TPA: PKD domain-containing protein [Candidatus Woesebacteria bacterium]|nr:PKD domain-containing protein [Candidatus Woesebacteria bacterium]
MDKRYQEKYEMSEIANLKTIKEKGIESLVKQEEEKWLNSEGTYCVHDKKRYKMTTEINDIKTPPSDSTKNIVNTKQRSLYIFLTLSIIFATIAIGVFAYNRTHKTNPAPIAENINNVETPTPTLIPTITVLPTISPTLKPTAKPTIKPTATPTSSTPVVDNSCSYDLNGATGAVKIDIKPQSNLVVGDQIVELHAKSGCKILDGRSTDTQTLIARAGGNGYSSINSVTYSSVPPGSYSVRIQYKGQWTGYQNVTAVTGQSRTVEFLVSGDNPPPTSTPTPAPKPTCQINIMSASSGPAPFTANFVYGAIYQGSGNYVTGARWDWTGDGNWDTDMLLDGNVNHTYADPGSYTVKMQVQTADGLISDPCTALITVQ